jgi:hypothetical protein
MPLKHIPVMIPEVLHYLNCKPGRIYVDGTLGGSGHAKAICRSISPGGVFIGGSFDCPCDKQDRILIPQNLREYAEFEKDIVIVGVLDHFEIWSRDSWNKENMYLEKDMKKEDVRNEIAKLGL